MIISPVWSKIFTAHRSESEPDEHARRLTFRLPMIKALPEDNVRERFLEARSTTTCTPHLRTMFLLVSRKWCPGRDLNPHSPCGEKDFKSFASADFATRAY